MTKLQKQQRKVKRLFIALTSDNGMKKPEARVFLAKAMNIPASKLDFNSLSLEQCSLAKQAASELAKRIRDALAKQAKFLEEDDD